MVVDQRRRDGEPQPRGPSAARVGCLKRCVWREREGGERGEGDGDGGEAWTGGVGVGVSSAAAGDALVSRTSHTSREALPSHFLQCRIVIVLLQRQTCLCLPCPSPLAAAAPSPPRARSLSDVISPTPDGPDPP